MKYFFDNIPEEIDYLLSVYYKYRQEYGYLNKLTLLYKDRDCIMFRGQLAFINGVIEFDTTIQKLNLMLSDNWRTGDNPIFEYTHIERIHSLPHHHIVYGANRQQLFQCDNKSILLIVDSSIERRLDELNNN